MSVVGLNVGNVLKADQIIGKLSLRYNTREDRVMIDTSGSRFVGLRIGDRGWDVTLDHALGREASDYAVFRQNHPEYPEVRGVIRSSLGRHPDLIFNPHEHGYFHVPNFGRIYFAEWSAGPYTQSLTMLRLRLASPQEAEMEVDDGTGNGQPYP